MNPIKDAREHLQLVNESYSTHALFAIRWGFFLIWTGLASIIHGILPSLFPFTAPRNLLKLKSIMDVRKEEERIARFEQI